MGAQSRRQDRKESMDAGSRLGVCFQTWLVPAEGRGRALGQGGDSRRGTLQGPAHGQKRPREEGVRELEPTRCGGRRRRPPQPVRFRVSPGPTGAARLGKGAGGGGRGQVPGRVGGVEGETEGNEATFSSRGLALLRRLRGSALPPGTPCPAPAVASPPLGFLTQAPVPAWWRPSLRDRLWSPGSGPRRPDLRPRKCAPAVPAKSLRSQPEPIKFQNLYCLIPALPGMKCSNQILLCS
ncbi:protein eva-1 homolog A isoform X1 [Camelus bactrianus]|uniref:Protein eva-1 homolog A isoform X1 n=2 Tax=Camelus bactrianus TaxID=9837 RepID=A0AC58PKD6_CAMBA